MLLSCGLPKELLNDVPIVLKLQLRYIVLLTICSFDVFELIVILFWLEQLLFCSDWNNCYFVLIGTSVILFWLEQVLFCSDWNNCYFRKNCSFDHFGTYVFVFFSKELFFVCFGSEKQSVHRGVQHISRCPVAWCPTYKPVSWSPGVQNIGRCPVAWCPTLSRCPVSWSPGVQPMRWCPVSKDTGHQWPEQLCST